MSTIAPPSWLKDSCIPKKRAMGVRSLKRRTNSAVRLALATSSTSASARDPRIYWCSSHSTPGLRHERVSRPPVTFCRGSPSCHGQTDRQHQCNRSSMLLLLDAFDDEHVRMGNCLTQGLRM